MYAADEVYDTAELEDVIALLDRCTYPVEAEPGESGLHIVRCGGVAVDDEDEPRCDEHLGMVWP